MGDHEQEQMGDPGPGVHVHEVLALAEPPQEPKYQVEAKMTFACPRDGQEKTLKHCITVCSHFSHHGYGTFSMYVYCFKDDNKRRNR